MKWKDTFCFQPIDNIIVSNCSSTLKLPIIHNHRVLTWNASVIEWTPHIHVSTSIIWKCFIFGACVTPLRELVVLLCSLCYCVHLSPQVIKNSSLFIQRGCHETFSQSGAIELQCPILLVASPILSFLLSDQWNPLVVQRVIISEDWIILSFVKAA